MRFCCNFRKQPHLSAYIFCIYLQAFVSIWWTIHCNFHLIYCFLGFFFFLSAGHHFVPWIMTDNRLKLAKINCLCGAKKVSRSCAEGSTVDWLKCFNLFNRLNMIILDGLKQMNPALIMWLCRVRKKQKIIEEKISTDEFTWKFKINIWWNRLHWAVMTNGTKWSINGIFRLPTMICFLLKVFKLNLKWAQKTKSKYPVDV